MAAPPPPQMPPRMPPPPTTGADLNAIAATARASLDMSTGPADDLFDWRLRVRTGSQLPEQGLDYGEENRLGFSRRQLMLGGPVAAVNRFAGHQYMVAVDSDQALAFMLATAAEVRPDEFNLLIRVYGNREDRAQIDDQLARLHRYLFSVAVSGLVTSVRVCVCV